MYPNLAVANSVGSIVPGNSSSVNTNSINSTIGVGSENRPLF